MRDKRKFCRPKTTKNPTVGDINIKLKCGEILTVSPEVYNDIKDFFELDSVYGEISTGSAGNVKVYIPEINLETIINVSDYDPNKFELVEVLGEKKDPFGLYEYVDLGLPSGTLWCKTNVGAATEGARGNYYKFGETTVYDGSDYNVSDYDEACDPNASNVELPREYDAANVNQGGDWHIPTRAQWNELINNTTHTYISDYNSTGIAVIKFEKTNDSSTFIIIPAGGSYTDGEFKLPENAYYWTQTVHYGSVYYAILTENSYFFADWTTAFGHGFLVRAVCDAVDNSGLVQKGDVICHNTTLNKDAMFTYSDWITLSDEWELTGLYGIETYDEEHASDGDYVIMANGHTLIINPLDYSDVSSLWEHVDTISK